MPRVSSKAKLPEKTKEGGLYITHRHFRLSPHPPHIEVIPPEIPPAQITSSSKIPKAGRTSKNAVKPSTIPEKDSLSPLERERLRIERELERLK